ncbi:hypothetical protein JXA12_05690 [Candidatus Woesearchaeota archaeon]|nr:hypothetical protein [Candidatus Woesearchaeota archaeon]
MDISNKSLAMFLVAAIVVSIAGTVISLNKLGTMTGVPTGFNTFDVGNVTLEVGQTLSITLDDETIDFGTCTPDSGGMNHINISSTLQYGNGVDTCTAPAAVGGDGLDLRNDGNLAANVTMNVTATAVGAADSGSFLDSGTTSASRVWYRVDNTSANIPTYDGGCFGAIQDAYYQLTGAADYLPICENLENRAGGNGRNSVRIDFNITLPYDVTENDYFEVDLWAKQA